MTETRKDYCIIEAPERGKLEQTVIQMIRQGWKPEGSPIIVALGDDNYLYAQAMTLNIE